jgi:hypothetical protein
MPTLKHLKIIHVEYKVYCRDLSAFIAEITGNELSVYSLLSDELRHSYYPDRKYVVMPEANVQWTKFCLYNDPVNNIQNILDGLCTDNFIVPGNYTIYL